MSTKCLAQFVTAFPSLRRLAKDIGVAQATVERWRDRDSIPGTYWVAIERAAQRQGIRWITVEALALAAAAKRRVA